jgi:hypothetical protein
MAKGLMKKNITVLVALFGVASAALCQEATPKSDVDIAIKLYKERAAEGSNPTLLLKDGGVTLYERALQYQQWPGVFPTPATKPQTLQLAQIKALEDQVATLKELVAELEKQLAACTPKQQ